MADSLTMSLLITLLGMGLVFGAIVLFWVFMSGLVRLAAGQADDEGVQREAAATDATAMARLASHDADLRRRAALAAALAALAQAEADQETGPGRFPLPPTALVSSWQAVLRARHLAERGSRR